MRVTADGGASDNCMDTYIHHRALAGAINHIFKINVNEPQKKYLANNGMISVSWRNK